MKKLSLLIAMLFFINGVYAQYEHGEAPLSKGKRQLNFGLGFSDGGIPLYGSLDFAVHKDVTVTPEIHMVIDNKFRMGVLVKADYHWNYLIGIPSNWDFYAGVRAGFEFINGFDPNIGIEVGGRWYWNETWGLNLEFGGGTGYSGTFGLSKKL